MAGTTAVVEEVRVPDTVRPIIVTPDVERLRAFYAAVAAAEEIFRYPEQGPVAYLGLRIGDSELGLSASEDVTPGEPGRLLLSIEVNDVDAALPAVTAHGGEVLSQPADMPWGQRVAHVKDPDGTAVNLTRAL
jgi:predicted enzyme related to lactoylglutathione lyase